MISRTTINHTHQSLISNIDDIIENWRKEANFCHLDHEEDGWRDIADKFGSRNCWQHFVAGGITTQSVVLEAQTTSWWAASHHNIAQCAY